MEVLKYIGAAYILWLAIHIAFSKPSTENAEQSASFLKGFMLQFVNVKIYMFGVTALTGYVVGYMSSFPALLFFELVIATIGTIATCTWTGLGAPYKDKLTVFRTGADMDDSTNPGILLVQPETGRFRVRMDGMMTEYTVGGSEPSLLEEPVRKLIDTLFKDYSYVLW